MNANLCRCALLTALLGLSVGGAAGFTTGSSNLSGTAIANPRGADGSPLAPGNLSLVIVDTHGDGFAAAQPGSLTAGTTLSDTLGSPDDHIVATNASAAPVPGVLHQVLGSATIDLGAGIDPGDPIAIVFFDQVAATDPFLNAGAAYVVATHSTWKVPNAGASLEFSKHPQGSGLQQLEGVQANLTIQGDGAISYENWAATYFGAADAPNAEPGSDPDGDGCDNLREYAFGMDPLIANARQVENPRMSTVKDANGEVRLLVDYSYPLAHTSAVIYVEVSTDLKSWQRSSDDVEEVLRESTASTERLLFRSTSTADRLFMRTIVKQVP